MAFIRLPQEVKVDTELLEFARDGSRSGRVNFRDGRLDQVIELVITN